MLDASQEVMETGTVSCHLLILLSCKGEKSLKPDGQHTKGTPVTLALKAFSNRMTYTPLSYKNTQQRTLTHTHMLMPQRELSQKERLFC